MGGFLVDTSVLSGYYHVEHPKNAIAKQLIDRVGKSDHLFVSVVTMAEIDYGVRMAGLLGCESADKMAERADIIRNHAPLGVTRHTGKAYAQLKSRLAQRVTRKPNGKLPKYVEEWVEQYTGAKLGVGENDLWICSQAVECELTVICEDRHFLTLKEAWPDVKILHPTML